MNHKVTVVVSSLLLLFSQTSVLSQSSFQNTTLANAQIAQQSESDSSSNTDSPKKRRSAGPRFIDLQFPDLENNDPYIYNPDMWYDTNAWLTPSYPQDQYFSIGLQQYKEGNLLAALESLEKAEISIESATITTGSTGQVATSNQDNKKMNMQIEIFAAIDNIKGLIYRDLGEWENSKKYFTYALSSFSKIDNNLGRSISLNNLGEISSQLKQHEKALDYYNQALEIYRKNTDRKKEQYALNKIALTYYELGEKKKSLDYLEQVLAIAEEQNDTVAEGITFNNIGEIYWSLGQKTTAKQYYEFALENFQDSNSELATKVEQNIASNLSTEKITFSCRSINGTPTTIANTIKDDISFISWGSSYFTSFLPPQQKCEIVTAKLEKGYQNGLKYLTTGYKNGQSVICMTSTNKGGCEEILFALRQDSDPEEQLQALLHIRTGAAASEPLNESSSRIYVDLEEYFNTAPPIQKSQPFTKRETTKVRRSQKPVSE